MPMANHNEVGADLPCVTCNLLDSIANQYFAGRNMASVGELFQAIGKNVLVLLPFQFHLHVISTFVVASFNGKIGRGRRHDGDEK